MSYRARAATLVEPKRPANSNHVAYRLISIPT
jgi:hypothetical protein